MLEIKWTAISPLRINFKARGSGVSFKNGFRLLAASVLLAVVLWVAERDRSTDKEQVMPTVQSGTPQNLNLVSGVAKNMSETKSKPSTSDLSLLLEKASPEDRAKLSLVNEVLDAHNDNDQRLDKEFNHLSAGAKKLFRAQYEALPQEKHNTRGTLVYLLGRNLSETGDFDFLHKVLSEPACLGMADCSKEDPGSTSSDSLHHDLGTDTTLAYSQLVTLKSIEALLANKGASSELKAAAFKELEYALHSQNFKVSSLAEHIRKKYAGNRR